MNYSEKYHPKKKSYEEAPVEEVEEAHNAAIEEFGRKANFRIDKLIFNEKSGTLDEKGKRALEVFRKANKEGRQLTDEEEKEAWNS